MAGRRSRPAVAARGSGQRVERRSPHLSATTKLIAAKAAIPARAMVAVSALVGVPGSIVSVAGAVGAAVASTAMTAVSVSPVSEPTANTEYDVPALTVTGSRSSGQVPVPVAQTSRS